MGEQCEERSGHIDGRETALLDREGMAQERAVVLGNPAARLW